jgi:hypothetical protein
MNCADWETRVALHAGGDLTGAKAMEVEQHLGECSAYQLLWSGAGIWRITGCPREHLRRRTLPPCGARNGG